MPQIFGKHTKQFLAPMQPSCIRRESAKKFTLLRYLPFYSLALSELLGKIQPKVKLPTKKLDVLVLGGGPGTELLGVSHFLASQSARSSKTNFRMLDKHAASWSHARDIVKDHVVPKLGAGKCLVKHQDCDFTKPLASEDEKWAGQPNLIVVQNMFNEIAEGNDTQVAVSNVTKLIDRGSEGCVVVFIDRNYSIVDRALGSLKSKAETSSNLTLLGENVNEQPWSHDCRRLTSEVDDEIAKYLFKVHGKDVKHTNWHSSKQGLVLSLKISYKYLMLVKKFKQRGA